ncbi:acetate--CoA ligase family protein [uncultured Candidatus Puniceispirillum sp.]|uniref:acetate--CoA ligase family protein n=2 Tax=Candidatus Puniceispirillum TaxID=767891 RepID=UPI0032B0F84A
MTDLSRLFRPKTIAIFGGRWAENVIAQCLKMGFDGDIWPVHPTRETMGGLPCFKDVDALPDAPDAAFLGINRHAIIEVAAALAARNCGGAICFASGFAETGDANLQAELIAAAGTMPILGPNCYGFINYLDGVPLWPDQHGGAACETGVALISQSSNIAINLTMQARGLPLAYVACVGNQAQTSLIDMANALFADDRVTAAGLYIEGIDDAPAFARMAAAARQNGKYIVAIKSGKTEASQIAAQTHTAAIAGDASCSSAFLAQCGVYEVDTLEDMLELLKILHLFGPLNGNRITAMCCSGGEVGLIGDMSAKHDLVWPNIPEDNATYLAKQLGALVTIANPLDYHTFIWGDEAAMANVFAAMMGGWTDISVLVIDFPRNDRCSDETWLPAVNALCEAVRRTGTKAAMLATLPEGISEQWAWTSIKAGIAPLCGLSAGLNALEKASNMPATFLKGWQPCPATTISDAPRLLDEADAKTLLSEAGITCPIGVRATTADDVTSNARNLRVPLALKGLGHLHKSEAGLIQLGLDHNMLKQAAFAMQSCDGFLIEEMVEVSVAELLVGLSRDPQYGISLTLGVGGIYAELLADTRTGILPLDRDFIEQMLSELHLAPLLNGYRGQPHADIDAALDEIMALCRLIQEDTRITEIEINPLILGATGQGATAVDALIWYQDNSDI